MRLLHEEIVLPRSAFANVSFDLTNGERHSCDRMIATSGGTRLVTCLPTSNCRGSVDAQIAEPLPPRLQILLLSSRLLTRTNADALEFHVLDQRVYVRLR
jgi:hypothetical protein